MYRQIHLPVHADMKLVSHTDEAASAATRDCKREAMRLVSFSCTECLPNFWNFLAKLPEKLAKKYGKLGKHQNVKAFSKYAMAK